MAAWNFPPVSAAVARSSPLGKTAHTVGCPAAWGAEEGKEGTEGSFLALGKHWNQSAFVEVGSRLYPGSGLAVINCYSADKEML